MKYFLIITALIGLMACNQKPKKSFVFKYDTKIEQSESSNLKLNLTFPHFGNVFVDELISEEIDKLKSSFKKSIGDDVISENWKNEQRITVECFYTDKGYLSLLFKNYLFSGGAHGNTMLKSIILHPDSRQVFGLKDFFEGEYFTQLQLKTRQSLREELGFDAFIDEGTESVADFSVFTLSNSGICFYFPPYQVAAYSYGTLNITFPYSDFSTYRSPE